MTHVSNGEANVLGRAGVRWQLSDTDRHIRMLTTLLAGCDPCGWVGDGGSPELYADTAAEVAQAMRRDSDVVGIIMIMPGEAALEPATKFALVAVDWWRTTSALRSHSPQGAQTAA